MKTLDEYSDLFVPGQTLVHSYSGDVVEVVSFDLNKDEEMILTLRYDDGEEAEIRWAEFDDWEACLFVPSDFGH